MFLIEDEYNLLLICDLYSNLRKEYLSFIGALNQLNYIRVMSTNDPDYQKSLATFIYQGQKLRWEYLNKKK